MAVPPENLIRTDFLVILKRVEVACVHGDGATIDIPDGPRRTSNAHSADLGNGRAAPSNRGARAQRYASSMLLGQFQVRNRGGDRKAECNAGAAL